MSCQICMYVHAILNVCWWKNCPRMPLSHGMSHDDLALSVHARHQCSLAQWLFLQDLHGPSRTSPLSNLRSQLNSLNQFFTLLYFYNSFKDKASQSVSAHYIFSNFIQFNFSKCKTMQYMLKHYLHFSLNLLKDGKLLKFLIRITQVYFFKTQKYAKYAL